MKTLLMLMLIIKNMTNNTMYIVQELHNFYNNLQFHYKSLSSHQYSHYTPQTYYQLFLFCTYIFYNLHITLHQMNYNIHNHN